jgi:hypothetical protein
MDGVSRRNILKNVKILVEDLGIDVRVILKTILGEQILRMHIRFIWSTWSPEGCSGEHFDQKLT